MFAQTQKNDTIRKDTTTTIPEKKIIKYTLKGIVTGETDDETLPGAHIYVGEDKKPTTVTNAMGEFTLKDLLPGELVITASFVGYQATTQKYLVKVDTNVGIIKLLPEVLKTPGTCRASFYLYNTKEEVDQLIDALKNATVENCVSIFF